MIISILFAWGTYQLVEKPIRFGKYRKRKAIVLLISMGIIAGLGLNSYARDGLKQRNAEKISNFNDFTFPPAFRNACLTLKESPDSSDWCNDGNIAKDPSVALMGDSVATSYSQLLLNLNKEFSFSFKQFGRDQCPPLLNFGPKVCREASQHYFDLIKKTAQTTTVILAAHWPSYVIGKNYDWLHYKTTAEDLKKSLVATLEYLISLNKKVIIFQTPPLGAKPRSCIRLTTLTKKNTICDMSLARVLRNDGGSRELIKEMTHLFPAVKIFDPFKYLCNEQHCKASYNQKVLYIDSSHMSFFGGEFLAEHGKEELIKLIMSLP